MNEVYFEVSVDAADKYRQRLVHDNGNILVDSGGGYASKQEAKQGIESVRRNAPDVDVIEAQPRGSSPRFV